MKVIWTTVVLADLKSIHEYISQDSKFYADRYIKRLIARVEQLHRFPESGKIVPEFNIQSLRELLEGNYRIIYKINHDHIGIVRVHHSSRSLPSL